MRVLLGSLALLAIAAAAPAQGQDATITATPASLPGEATQGGQEVARGNFTRAIQLLSAGLLDTTLSNDRRANMLNDRAVAYWRTGDLAAAVGDLNEAIRLFPEFAAPYNNRGNVLLALNQADEAIRDFDRAILLAPSYVAAFNNRAIARLQQGKLDEAETDFNRAAALSPSATAPINGRGRVNLARNRPFMAMRDFSRAIALDPTYRVGFRNRAQVRMAMRQYAEAIEDLTNALTMAPGDQALLLSRAMAQNEVQAYGPAIADAGKLIELNPASAPAFAERGRGYAQLGQMAESMADLAKAVEIDPRYTRAYVYRALAHLRFNEAELGLADVERALKLDPRSALAYQARGRCLEALGRAEAAVVDFRRAVKLDPEDRESWAGITRLTGEQRPADMIVAGSEVEDWNIIRDAGGRLYAEGPRNVRLRVPLETAGDEPPRLIAWEPMNGAYKGIGVLRYFAGTVKGAEGPEEVEMAALVDLYVPRLVSIEPYRQGQRQSVWTWTEAGTLTVRGADGMSSEFALRTPLRTSRVAQPGSDDFLFGNDGLFTPGKPRKAPAPPPRKKKTFSLFDLLFN